MMKKVLLVFAFILLGLNPSRAQDRLLLRDFRSLGSLTTFLSQYKTEYGDWPTDINGKPTACIIVHFSDFPISDAEAVQYDFSGNSEVSFSKEFLTDHTDPHVWIFVNSSRAQQSLEAVLDYGVRSNRIDIPPIEAEKVYEVYIANNITVSISITTIPEGAVVWMEGKRLGTPAILDDIRLGRHKLEIIKDGEQVMDTLITVTRTTTSFCFDIRPKKMVEFKSKPSGANIVVTDNDGKKVVEGISDPSVTKLLPYGLYQVIATLKSGEITKLQIQVSETSADSHTLVLTRDRVGSVEREIAPDFKDPNAYIIDTYKLNKTPKDNIVLINRAKDSLRVTVYYYDPGLMKWQVYGTETIEDYGDDEKVDSHMEDRLKKFRYYAVLPRDDDQYDYVVSVDNDDMIVNIMEKDDNIE